MFKNMNMEMSTDFEKKIELQKEKEAKQIEKIEDFIKKGTDSLDSHCDNIKVPQDRNDCRYPKQFVYILKCYEMYKAKNKIATGMVEIKSKESMMSMLEEIYIFMSERCQIARDNKDPRYYNYMDFGDDVLSILTIVNQLPVDLPYEEMMKKNISQEYTLDAIEKCIDEYLENEKN